MTRQTTAARAAGDQPARARPNGNGRAGTRVDRARQREEFGGFNWGSAFFGWLVAVGITALLTALLSAAGAAIGLTQLSDSDARSSAGTISIVGGILVILVLAIGYYAGGYVAGRMSRFDGGRQGLGVWLIGLVVTVVLAAAGAIAGSKYNLLGQLNLPRIPIDEGSLASGAAIALAIVLLVTLLAAMSGGKVGQRYHRKVDRVGGVQPA
jgi:MFS family permease